MGKPTKGVTRRQFLEFLGKFLLASGIFGLIGIRKPASDDIAGPFYAEDFGTEKPMPFINEHLAQNAMGTAPPITYATFQQIAEYHKQHGLERLGERSRHLWEYKYPDRMQMIGKRGVFYFDLES